MHYLIISILSIAWPGLGHIFIRKYKFGIIFFLTAIIIQIIFFQYFCFNFTGFIVSLITSGIITVFSLVNAIIGYKKNKTATKHTLGILLIIISIFLKVHYNNAILKYLKYRIFTVSSSVMENTILYKEIIVVDYNKNYKYVIKPGDIIIFKAEDRLRVSRCIALENDKIEIIKDNVYINGNLINEPYKYLDTEYLDIANTLNFEEMDFDYPSAIIDQNKIFILGDNRYNSNDSRFMGQLPIDFVVGKALYIVSSKNLKRIGKML